MNTVFEKINVKKLSVQDIISENNIAIKNSKENSISLQDGIYVVCNNSTFSNVSKKHFIKTEDIYLNIKKSFSLKSHDCLFLSNHLLLHTYKHLDIKCDYGNINIASNSIDIDSICLKSYKGGIKIESDKNININSTHEINIGLDNSHLNFGNSKSIMTFNNDIIIKGNIINNVNQITKIGTCLGETSESILLLGKDNKYGSNFLGFIAREKHIHIGFLYDTLQNEFFLSEHLQFSLDEGVKKNNTYGKLKLGNIMITNNANINGNLNTSSFQCSSFVIDKRGNINSNSNLNFNDSFLFESSSKQLTLNGDFYLNDIYMNKIIDKYINKKSIEEYILEHIKDDKIILELNHLEDYKEDIILDNINFSINGNYSNLIGSIELMNTTIENKSNYIQNLNIIVEDKKKILYRIDIHTYSNYFIQNQYVYLKKDLDIFMNIEKINGILIIDNLNIDLNTQYKIDILFHISQTKKIIIKNSLLIANKILHIDKHSDTDIIILNCFMDGSINYEIKNLLLIGNTIRNSDHTFDLKLKNNNNFI